MTIIGKIIAYIFVAIVAGGVALVAALFVNSFAVHWGISVVVFVLVAGGVGRWLSRQLGLD